MKSRLMRGFTLIELLVVISIVGMLSSITLASVQAARDKGRIASGLGFASYNYHAIGIDTIGYWNFEGTSPCGLVPTILCVADAMGRNTVLKTFTNNNEYTSTNIDGYFSTNTPTGKGKSGIIDANHYFANTDNANISLSKKISSLNLKPKDFTVSTWVYFTSANPDGPIVHLSRWTSPDGSSYDLESVFGLDLQSGQYVCFSDVYGASVFFGPVIKNSWQNITCSFNSTTGTVAGFLDGKKVNSITANYNPDFYVYNDLPINSVSIGSGDDNQPSPPAPTNFTGFIDDVIIYGAALVE